MQKEMEERNIHLKEQMMFSELLERIEKRRRKIHRVFDGDREAAEGFGGLFSDLQEEIKRCEEDSPEKRSPAFDPEALPKTGELLIEGERLCLLGMQEKDRKDYLEVEKDVSFFKEAFSDESFLAKLWEEFFRKNRAYYSIFNWDAVFLGYCGILNLQAKPWEMAIALKEKYQGQGIGPESLLLLMKALKRRTGERVFRGRVDADNEASISMMRKIGGKAHGISEFFLYGKKLQNYEKKNEYLVDQRLKELAEEFQVEPQELLGHSLEFWVELPE